jgi:hypothetical protein
MDYETSLRWYCTVGGIPYYHLNTNGKSYRQLIEGKFFDADSSWRGDAHSIILQEFNGNTHYTGAVKCISDGAVKQSEIADRLHIDRAACKRILDDLEFVGMVERRIPMGGSPKKPVYSIKDPFISFSFGILSGNLKRIESSSSKSAVYRHLQNDIDSQVGHMFEKLCGDWLDSNFSVIERGQWWGRVDDTDADIDVVAKVADGNGFIHTILGECKFSRKPMGLGAYNTLVSRAKAAGFSENVTFVLFSALGFEEELVEFAEENGVILVSGRVLAGLDETPSLFTTESR